MKSAIASLRSQRQQKYFFSILLDASRVNKELPEALSFCAEHSPLIVLAWLFLHASLRDDAPVLSKSLPQRTPRTQRTSWKVTHYTISLFPPSLRPLKILFIWTSTPCSQCIDVRLPWVYPEFNQLSFTCPAFISIPVFLCDLCGSIPFIFL